MNGQQTKSRTKTGEEYEEIKKLEKNEKQENENRKSEIEAMINYNNEIQEMIG